MTEYNHDEPTAEDHQWAERVVGLLLLGGAAFAGLVVGYLLRSC